MTLFLYGTSLPGQPDNRWYEGLVLRPATVRGTLFRTARHRPALQPDPAGKPIQGALVDVEDARLPVLDLVELAGQELLQRLPVRASAQLRSVEAQAWVLPPDTKAPRGWRRLQTDDWTRLARRSTR